MLATSFSCNEPDQSQTSFGEAPPVESSRLREYVAIDTSNPPGGERRGALYLRSILDEAGIDAELVGPEGRESLVARLDSGRDAPALLLHHHIDTVALSDEEPQQRSGYVTGSGVLDTKSLGIAHLRAFLALAKSDQPLSRDVLFMAVADEESGGSDGMGWLLEERPDLFEGVEWALGEGGGNVAVTDEQRWWGIEISQKSPLWIRVHTSGAGGHGATGGTSTAVSTLVDLIPELLDAVPERPVVTEEIRHYFESLASSKSGRIRSVLEAAAENPSDGNLARLPAPQRSVTKATAVVTSLRAGSDAANVVPASASATIDYRLPPGISTDSTLEHIQRIASGRARIEVLLDEPEPSPSSPPGGPFWDLLMSSLGRLSYAPAGPLVTPAFNDNRHLRRHGIIAYGFSPFKLNYYDAATIHTSGERIREDFFEEGVDFMERLLFLLAAD